MSLINVSNLTFAYEGSYDNIFENVSFQIDTDWKLGFTGRNGRGKTTFLNLLLKKYEYSGSITSSTNFEYFPYSVSDKELFTIDIVKEICPEVEDWEIYKEFSLLEGAEDALYRPFYTLSNGEQTKALLAAMFLKENSYLLIDEPTNHLDSEGRKAVSSYLNKKHGYILVSHDRVFLDNCIDHILSINKTNIEIQRGNFSSWLRNKEMQDSYETARNEKLKKDINRLNAAAERTIRWSENIEKTKFGTKNSGLRPDRGFIGHKAAKMAQRSKTIGDRRKTAADEKSSLMKNIESNESLKLSPLKFHTEKLAELKDISIFYGEKTACSNISFTIEHGDRIALRGKNGSGKSSILKLICGEKVNYNGLLIKNKSLKISYVPQNFDFLCGSLDSYAQQKGIDISLFKAILRKLDFSRTQFDKNIENFSGGQKKKVLIAGSLCEEAHLYIWDEPLNYIDVISRIQIETLLEEYRPTLLFVEHDQAFLDKIANKIIDLDKK